MRELLLICAGGALGTGARHLISGWALRAFGPGLPWGTWTVNIAGSFVLSLVAALGASGEWLSPTLRLTLTVGLLGGFTTYSSFNHQTLAYLDGGDFARAGLNIALTLTACLAASLAGLWLGRWISGS